MSLPLVSIVIPCFNAERYIGKTLESALSQDYPNCEVIVVDDGSTDGSLGVVEGFSGRVRVERQENCGGCVARNRGLSFASGEWVQFLDADDALRSNKISLQLKCLDYDPTRVSTCQLELTACIDQTGPELSGGNVFSLDGPNFLVQWLLGTISKEMTAGSDLQTTFGNTTSWLASKAIYEKCGGWNSDLAMCQDSEMYCRVLSHASQVVAIARPLAFYRIGVDSSVSSGVSRKKAESFLRYCSTVEEVLRKLDLPDSEKAIASCYCSFLSRFYPLYPELAHQALSAIARTGVSPEEVVQPQSLKKIARVLGVKNAILWHKRIRNARSAMQSLLSTR
ncbi:glycosyltransferase family 2 protein [Rhodopirellula sp. MGV]|uniref:glycosyltransferase family 2 protein n=1 Tax=Rhodopirellula sp. MGV TaxID=2023130 RepID=UPI000B95DD42|nr:glycosyltransferase family 2 protein [Rhodopirellula sp. MGV]OYP34106.1 hypothetical protein CGZ80_16405 [Rhodopirellula sp. MGV]PNY35619.1 hypothetical protein C2E31_17290 [Rhodopirellula baltica]